jgi:hypothetical protein
MPIVGVATESGARLRERGQGWVRADLTMHAASSRRYRFFQAGGETGEGKEKTRARCSGFLGPTPHGLLIGAEDRTPPSANLLQHTEREH